MNNDRQAGLAGLTWRYGDGSALHVEVEGQRNHRPFSFGTVYVNGQFLFDRSYVGPQARSQNIGGFSLDLDNPNFDLDLSALPLSPRFSGERYVETGRYVLDRMSVGEAWHVLAGVRRSRVQLDTGNATALRRATDVGQTNTALGVAHKLPGVPWRYGALGLRWRTAPVRLWASVALVGPRPGDVENSFRAPGYARLDAGGVVPLGSGTELTASVANLLDKRYVEALTAADNVYQGERRRASC